MKARILVRTDVDWSSMTEESFASQVDPTRPLGFLAAATENDLPGTFREVFGVDFFRYRAEVRRIAEASLRNVRDVQVSTGFEGADAWFLDGEDEFIFPTDDDDFFRPDLARAVEHAAPGTRILLWDAVQAGLAPTDPNPVCRRVEWSALGSNNWAVRKSFLREQFPDTWKEFLSDHEFAQRSMVRFLDVPLDYMPEGPMRSFAPLLGEGVMVLSDCYSLNSLHIGSLQFFCWLLWDGSPRDLYPTFATGQRVPLQESVRWAEPYVDEVSSLISRLQRGA